MSEELKDVTSVTVYVLGQSQNSVCGGLKPTVT